MSRKKSRYSIISILTFVVLVFIFTAILVDKNYLTNGLSSFFGYITGENTTKYVRDPNLNKVEDVVSSVSSSTLDIIKDKIQNVITSTPTPVSLPKKVGHEVGIAAGSNLMSMSDQELDTNLSGISNLGAKWVRLDIEWGFIQYDSPNTYDWSKYDRIISFIIKHNLKVLPILTYTPEWARVPGCGGGAHCPPADPKAFAKFSTAAVNHYKDYGIHYWEIWNEPNSYDFWATKADCRAYTKLLIETYPAIKSADTSAFVITGGMAPISSTDVNISPTDFLSCIYRNGGKNYFDAVGHHPYTFPETPKDNDTNAWVRMSTDQNSLRGIMVANGDSDKKIWITEYGAPTNGPDSRWYVSEDSQVRMVQDVMDVYKNTPWVGPIFWYTYIDSGTTLTSNENFFGLVRKDGSKKPAYETLKNIITGIK